jgi:hypothetical protein
MYRSLFLILACLSILSSCSREIQDPCTNKKPSVQLTQMDIGVVCFETVDSYWQYILPKYTTRFIQCCNHDTWFWWTTKIS